MLSHIWGIFCSFSSFSSSSSSFSAPPSPQPQGPYPSLEAQISVSRFKSQPRGPDPRGGEGENSPYVRKHRSSTPLRTLPCSPFNFKLNLLRQGTGTADHLTLLRLLSLSSFPSCPFLPFSPVLPVWSALRLVIICQFLFLFFRLVSFSVSSLSSVISFLSSVSFLFNLRLLSSSVSFFLS